MTDLLTASLRDEIIRRVVEVVHPERIILFGSHARGDAQEQSDVDLLVVMHEVTSRHDAIMQIREVLVPLGISIES